MDIRSLEALSKSMPSVEIKKNTIENILARVLKTLFGVGQKSLENLVHETAKAVAETLDMDEIQLFRDIARPDGSLFWNGEQDDAMKNILLSKGKRIGVIQSFDALYKK